MVDKRRRTSSRRRLVQVDHDIDSTNTLSENIIEDSCDNSEEVTRMDTTNDTEDDDDDDVQENDNAFASRDDLDQMKSIHRINREAENICAIVQKYEKLIPNDLNDHQDDNNPWYTQPKQIFQELKDAQIQLGKAWGNHDVSSDDNIGSLNAPQLNNVDNSISSKDDEKDEEVIGFRESYMELMTCAFEEELDAIRRGRILEPSLNHKKKQDSSNKSSQNIDDNSLHNVTESLDKSASIEEDVDVDILIDFLQSGTYLWTKEEKILFLKQKQKQNSSIQNGNKKRSKIDTVTKNNILTPHERRRQFLFGTHNW